MKPCLSEVIQGQVACSAVDGLLQYFLHVTSFSEIAFKKVGTNNLVTQSSTPYIQGPLNLVLVLSQPVQILLGPVAGIVQINISLARELVLSDQIILWKHTLTSSF